MNSKKSKNITGNIKEIVGLKTPMNYDAEVAVLGAMLLSKEAVSKVTSIFANDDKGVRKTSDDNSKVFYDERHREIYKAILELDKKNIIPDIIALQDHLSKQGTLELVGGSIYLLELSNKVSSATFVETHARIVQEYYFRRCLIELSEEILRNSYNESVDILEEIDNTEAKIFAIAEKRIRKNYKTMATLAMETNKLIQELYGSKNKLGVHGVTTGFSSLDRILNGGLQKSDLVILAARPAMGKTALALTFALNAALIGKKPVAFFSLEMDSKQLVLRMLSSISMLNLKVARNLNDTEWGKIATGMGLLRDLPLYFDDSPSLSIMELRSKCRRLKVEHQIELIVIDYLQLVLSLKAETREREISIISSTLKQIARELEVPVLALSQLNRGVETRTGKDKIPLLADLRESGSIEQDADVVMFIHRPEYYEKNEATIEANQWKNLAQIIISKHRNGATGIVNLSFIPEFVKFTEREMNIAAPTTIYRDNNTTQYQYIDSNENVEIENEYDKEDIIF